MPKIKRIHVNQHNIKSNRTKGTNLPPITCKTSSKNHKAHNVEIHGSSIVRYSPDKPLSCGAVMWIETKANVSLADENGNATGWVE